MNTDKDKTDKAKQKDNKDRKQELLRAERPDGYGGG
jgi:hypothetical protein